MKKTFTALSIPVLAIGMAPAVAMAQTDLMALDGDSLVGELQSRQQAGQAMTVDTAVVNANDPRFLWANEAKVQCGIALGYMKSNTKDETSIRKCALAADMMNRTPRVEAPQQAKPDEFCANEAPGIVFFEFDSAVPGPEAAQVVQFVGQNAAPCHWLGLQVVGHTDRAGSNAYNTGLARARAQAVADLLVSSGVNSTMLTVVTKGEDEPRVPTEDGVRNPQNRRVEIIVSK